MLNGVKKAKLNEEVELLTLEINTIYREHNKVLKTFLNLWFQQAMALSPLDRKKGVQVLFERYKVPIEEPVFQNQLELHLNCHHAEQDKNHAAGTETTNDFLRTLFVIQELIFEYKQYFPEHILVGQANHYYKNFSRLLNRIAVYPIPGTQEKDSVHWVGLVLNFNHLAEGFKIAQRLYQEYLEGGLIEEYQHRTGAAQAPLVVPQEPIFLLMIDLMITAQSDIFRFYCRMHWLDNARQALDKIEIIEEWFRSHHSEKWQYFYGERYTELVNIIQEKLSEHRALLLKVDPMEGDLNTMLLRFTVDWKTDHDYYPQDASLFLRQRASRDMIFATLERLSMDTIPHVDADHIKQALSVLHYCALQRKWQLAEYKTLLGYCLKWVIGLRDNLQNRLETDAAILSTFRYQCWQTINRQVIEKYEAGVTLPDEPIAKSAPAESSSEPEKKKKKKKKKKKNKEPQQKTLMCTHRKRGKKAWDNNNTDHQEAENDAMSSEASSEAENDEIPLGASSESSFAAQPSKSKRRRQRQHEKLLSAREQKSSIKPSIDTKSFELTVVRPLLFTQEYRLPRVSANNDLPAPAPAPAPAHAPAKASSKVSPQALVVNPPPTIPCISLSLEEHAFYWQQVDRKVGELMEKAEAAGREMYIVGGWFRDTYLGLEPADTDVVTDATLEELMKWCPELHRELNEEGLLKWGNKIDISSRLRAPHVTFAQWIMEDALKRDLKINATYFNKTRLLNPVGGYEELIAKEGPLTMVSDNIGAIFAASPQRMLRIIYIKNKIDRALFPTITSTLQSQVPSLKKIVFFKSMQWIDKLLRAAAWEKNRDYLMEANMLPFMFPNLGVNFSLFWKDHVPSQAFMRVIRQEILKLDRVETRTEWLALVVLLGVIKLTAESGCSFEEALLKNMDVLFASYRETASLSLVDENLYRKRLERLGPVWYREHYLSCALEECHLSRKERKSTN